MVKIPYDKIDAKVIDLCRALNEFSTVQTVGSCQGHENPKPGQAPAGQWWVKFTIKQTTAGWLDLEFLAWAINRDYAQGEPVQLVPDSPPPFANVPGCCLCFMVEGSEEANPGKLAEFLRQVREQYHGGT